MNWLFVLIGVAVLVAVLAGSRMAFAQGAGGAGATQRPVPPPSWADIAIPGVGLGRGASVPDLVAFGPSGGIVARAFDGGATLEQLYGACEIEHSYDEGTDLSPHVHWAPTTAGTGNVKWFFEYTVVNVDGTYGATTTLSVVDATDATAWKSHLASLGAIDGSALKIGAQLMFRLYRDPTDAEDTYGDDAALLTVGIHFQQDTVGSRQLSAK